MRAELDEATLQATVERARDYDPDAWESLFRHLYRRLFSYARNRLSSDQAAEDAVSEAFLRAMEKIEVFTWRGGGFDAWVYGILRNVVHEDRRNWVRLQQMQARQTAERICLDDGHEGDPQIMLSDAADRTVVRRAFSELEPDEQEVLELRVVGGLTSEDTAAVLGKRPGAVRMAQSRALDRLRVKVEELDRA